MHRIVKAIGAVATIALVATGCSQISTAPDQAGLHYKGGAFSATKFANCVEPSQRNFDGPGDKHYAYPAGQRTFSFTGKDSSEEGTIAVTTKDGQAVQIPGVVTFVLDTECDALRAFHEKIGLKYSAYMDGDKTSDGWINMLEDYMFIPLQAIMNNSAQNFGWADLYNNPAAMAALTKDITANLQTRIDDTMGAHYITVQKISLGRPVISEELQRGNTEIQRAHLDQQAQLQRNQVNQDKYQTFRDCLKVLSEQGCLLFYGIDSGKITVYPVPQGTGLNITP